MIARLEQRQNLLGQNDISRAGRISLELVVELIDTESIPPEVHPKEQLCRRKLARIPSPLGILLRCITRRHRRSECLSPHHSTDVRARRCSEVAPSPVATQLQH